jgi:hypothetical protein
MSTPIYLNEGALKSLEPAGLPGGSLTRRLRVNLGEDEYVVDFRKLAKPATFTHPAERPEQPTLGECAQVAMKLAGLLLAPIPDCGGTPQPQSFAEWSDLMWGHRKTLMEASPDVSEREDGPGPDFAAGWEEYRRQLRETHACVVPAWEELPMEVKECWCAGVWQVLDEYFPLRRYEFVGHRVLDCGRCRGKFVAHRMKHRETGLEYWLLPAGCVCGASASFAGGDR